MITRLIALFLVSFALGGCAHRVTTTIGPDGTRSTTSETRWAPSTYVAPLIYAPAPRYGYDHYNRGYYQQGVAPVLVPTPNGRGGTMFVPTCFPGVRNSPPGPDGLCYR